MFIEQIIRFELRSPGPLVVHLMLKLAIFMTKQRSSRKMNLLSKLLPTAKYTAGGNVPGFPSSGPSQLQNLSKKCNVLNVNCK